MNESPYTGELVLPSDCTIYEMAALHAQLTARLDQGGAVRIDVSPVERMDASFLQLLVATHKQAREQNIPLTVSGASETVSRWAETLYSGVVFSGELQTAESEESDHES